MLVSYWSKYIISLLILIGKILINLELLNNKRYFWLLYFNLWVQLSIGQAISSVPVIFNFLMRKNLAARAN